MEQSGSVGQGVDKSLSDLLSLEMSLNVFEIGIKLIGGQKK